MAQSPRSRDLFELGNQLGCFPRNEDAARTSAGTSRGRSDRNSSTKTSGEIFDDREKELMEVRNFWQEEYKNKSNEVAKLEKALKEATEMKDVENEELRMTYDAELNARNREILELKRTLDDLSGTKEEMLASVEKSTESKLRAKDAEVARLRIWLEEAKKSNTQGREVLSSYQKRLADKEAEMEGMRMSSEDQVNLLGQKIEKLQALLSEAISERNTDNENTKMAFDSVVKEKERQIAMMKESTTNQLKSKEQENRRKGEQIEELASKLHWVETQLAQERLDEGHISDLKTRVTSLLKKMSNLKSEKCFLEKDFAGVVSEMQTKEHKLADIQTKYESQSHDKDLLQRKCDSLERDLKDWKSAMKFFEEERSSLENDARSLRSELEKKGNNLCELECKFQSGESLRQNLEEVIRQLREENAEGFQVQKNLESELRERDREINVLKEELNISEKDFAFEKEQKSAVEANAAAAIDDLRGKCEESQKENDDLKANLNEREIDIASLTRLLEDGKKNESRLEAELEQLSEELELLNEKCMREKHEKEAIESSLRLAVASKEDEMEELGRKFEKRESEQKYEMERREECWSEAMKAKDNLVTDVRRSAEERLGWKEAEIHKLQQAWEGARLELFSVKESLERSVASKTEQILHLESHLKGKDELLATAEKAVEDLQGRLHECEQNYVTEIKSILQASEKGFKQRENVAEKLKKTIQENAVKYGKNLQEKDEKISALERELENSSKDMEDMRENLASFIQESSNNDAKLNRDLGIVQEECATLESKLFEVKKTLENRNVEVEVMERNMINAVSDFEQKQKLKLEEIVKLETLMNNERGKVLELEEMLSYQKAESVQKEQTVADMTGTVKMLEEKLTEAQNEGSSLREKLEEIQNLVKLSENEKDRMVEEKQNLLQELEKQKQFTDEKSGKIAVLLHKIKVLKNNYLETAKKQEKLEEGVGTLQVKLKEKDAVINDLKKECEIKKAKCEEYSVLLEEISQRRVQFENTITELKETVRVQKEEIGEALRREEELKGAVQELLSSLKDNEVNAKTLVSKLQQEVTQYNELRTEYENLKVSSLEESRHLNEKIDQLREELNKQQKALNTLNNEKESLLSELGKAKQTEESTRTSMGGHIEDLKEENAVLQEKVSSMDEELRKRFTEIAEINSALASADVVKDFLSKEVERLTTSESEKDESLRDARKSLETLQKEKSRLQYETKSLKNNLSGTINEKDNVVKSFEEFKTSASNMKQKMEHVLSDKESTITSAEDMIQRLKQGNEALTKELSKWRRERQADKKCVMDLLAKNKELSLDIESLSKDKSVLEAALKDLDVYPVKLKTTQGDRALVLFSDLTLIFKSGSTRSNCFM